MTIPAGQVAASLVLAMKEQRQFSEFLSACLFSLCSCELSRSLCRNKSWSYLTCARCVPLPRIVVTLPVSARSWFLIPPNTAFVVCFVVRIYIESWHLFAYWSRYKLLDTSLLLLPYTTILFSHTHHSARPLINQAVFLQAVFLQAAYTYLPTVHLAFIIIIPHFHFTYTYYPQSSLCMGITSPPVLQLWFVHR